MRSPVVQVLMLRRTIKNVSAINKAVRLKIARDVALYEIYQMVDILMLLWQTTLFQSYSSSI